MLTRASDVWPVQIKQMSEGHAGDCCRMQHIQLALLPVCCHFYVGPHPVSLVREGE